jgi:ATP-dependent helicase/nuclease subunit A
MLTPHQLMALDFRRHLSVTANAGSGKTRVLVARYMNILLSGNAEVGGVVALTYTDKAAGELKRRIAEEVSASLGVATDPVIRGRLERIREQLSGAFIGTIHGFCSRLLREHPVEAGVDAAFGVVEGLDQHIMLDEAMREAFQAILQGGTGPREGLIEVVRSLGKTRTIGAVRRLVEKRDQLDRLTGPGGLYQLSDDRLLVHWRSAIIGAVAAWLLDPEVLRDLESVVRVVDGKGAEDAQEAYRRLDRADDQRGRILAAWGLIQVLLKKDGGMYRSLATAAAEQSVAEQVERLGRLKKMLIPCMPAVIDPAEEADHRVLLRMTRTLLDVAQHVNERYERRKSEAGKLDFEDLQLRARSLLRREPVRKVLSARFNYVMVDEYQDTNQLQYDILRPLLADLASGNLCIVGDPKQSIYGFRGADVAVFERTRMDIVTVEGVEGDLVLGESFRPLRDLVAFVNLVFSHLMSLGVARGETGPGPRTVGYEPLVRARRNTDPGRVELLLDDDGDAETSTPEGERVARRILQIVSSEHRVFDASEQSHAARYRDIAVLLRSRTHLPEIEGAFSRLGVPYVVAGGVGYFQTQDILDYFNYIQFLVDPSDDVALAGILRSPFFVVSDAELYTAAARGRQESLWEDLRKRKDLPATLKDAVDALERDLVLCLRMPVPEVLSHITRHRLYMAKIAGTTRGAQAIANLEKLERMARAFELQGYGTLHDFTRKLKRLIDEEEDEGQGSIESRSDAVQVMTVHAAKGLEYPIVVLPFMHRKLRSDDPPFIHSSLGVAFDFQRGDGTEAEPPLMGVLREEARQRVEAEEQRIFYVACTRARDMLVLSGKHRLKKGEPSWMQWLLEALAWDPSGGLDALSFRCVTQTLEERAGAFITNGEGHELRIPLVRASQLPTGVSPPQTPGRNRVQPRISIAPLAAEGKGEIFSATRIRTYRECPALYYLKYVLGLPGEPGTVAGPEPEETTDADYPAELRGRVFHSVMQHIDSIPHGAGEIGMAVRRGLLAEAPLGETEADRLVEEITGRVLTVLGSDLWREAGVGTEIRTEFTVSAVFDNDYLSGTMDRVYRDGTGRFHVLDYKTDRVDVDTVRDRAEAYWPQLAFYALLVHRFFAVAEVEAILLFTSMVHLPLRRTFGEAELSAFEDEVRIIVQRIKAGDFRPVRTPCHGCPLMPQGCDFLVH